MRHKQLLREIEWLEYKIATSLSIVEIAELKRQIKHKELTIAFDCHIEFNYPNGTLVQILHPYVKDYPKKVGTIEDRHCSMYLIKFSQAASFYEVPWYCLKALNSDIALAMYGD